jgi:N-methylhydantoinase B
MIYSVASTVISQALLAAAKEMGIKLIRSAYSTVIREARDCSAALLSAEADCIAQSGLIPIHMAGAAQALRACLAQYPGETLSEGDFLLNNDPYSGAQHLPDVYMFTPIFVDGRLIAFSSTVCHHLDLGGGSPGLNATAEDLHGEGLVIRQRSGI